MILEASTAGKFPAKQLELELKFVYPAFWGFNIYQMRKQVECSPKYQIHLKSKTKPLTYKMGPYQL